MKRLIPTVFAFALSLGLVRAATPSFTMRIDDNHAPADWRKIADIFEARGIRLSFAVVPARLSEAQGACLKELAARGHLLMDHTPDHTFYRLTYHDKAAFDRAKAEPFVQEADEKEMVLRFKCEVDDANPKNRRVKAKVEKNVITILDKALSSRLFYTFVKLPGRPEVFGVSKRGEKPELYDFWRRPLKERIDLAECEILVYDQAALQPCDGVLRELAKASRERFDHFGLPRPKIWVRPGGWDPGVSAKSLERIYGGEFGYVGADSSVEGVRGASRWTTGYDAMYFFDQGADITPESLVDQIERKIGDGKFHVTLSHMWSHKLPGRAAEYFQKAERFADLIAARKIPVMTMAESLDARFGE